jgi:chromosome segregation ATPase
MGFFTVGNLITFAIVALTLFLYRQLDRKNHGLERVRKYADKVMGELDAYAAEKGAAVKDFGIALDVERKSAAELMKRLQALTEQELAEKAKAIARIDDRINAYDASLAELEDMTARVQENLNRLRDESVFVENVGRLTGEAREKLIEMEKDLGSILVRFDRENTEALDNAAGNILSSVKAAVAKLEADAGTLARQAEEHREAVDRIERERAANMARDLGVINKALKEAVEKAGTRADKMEETALLKLRDQAQDRVSRLQAQWEEKLKTSQEAVKTRLGETQERLKTFRDEWKTEQAGIEAWQKRRREEWQTEQDEALARQDHYREAWQKEIGELDARIDRQREEWRETAQDMDARINGQKEAWDAAVSSRLAELDAAVRQERETLIAAAGKQREEIQGAIAGLREELAAALREQRETLAGAASRQEAEITALIAGQREAWAVAARETEQRVLESTGARLEEYRQAQAEEFRQLAGLADDASRLEGELRLAMQETVNRVNQDFAQFEDGAARSRAAAAAEFSAQVMALKTEMDGVERELNALKSRAYENVSEKLQLFEDDFFADLGKRGAEIDTRLAEWQSGLDARLAELAETGAEERRNAELRLAEELRNRLAEQGQRLTAELERLKAETGAFEEGIREEMQGADETRRAFQEQLDQDLEEARRQAEDSAKNEIGRYGLAMAETLKRNQRELEEQLREIAGQVEAGSGEIAGFLEESRRNMEEWQNASASRIRDLDESMDEARRRIRDMVAESGERMAATRSSIEDIRKELTDQTKLFDRAGELRLELERRIEDLGGQLDGLDQRKSEIAQMENQFVRIKRLEDEVNAKMTRFLSEKHRIEVMETGFNRLLQTSQAVEEKLVQVSSSDDTLQALQVQIRRLDDAIRETEEKYQRIERKNQILEETNNGIDQNFKALQESEEAVRRTGEELARISRETETLREAIETLAADSGKARETMEKLDILDESLALIEKRIAQMQVAREWLARTETQLEELDKQAQNELRLISSLLNRESGKTPDAGKGSLLPRDRDNVIRLRRQGWNVEEIAKSMKISRDEVDLILEIGLKD